jgi:RNA-directed DNA polymerase
MSFRNDFTRLQTREHLVRALGISDDIFEAVLTFVPPPDPRPKPDDGVVQVTLADMLFFRHKIPKKIKARGHRLVWEVGLLKNEYKALARWLGSFLEWRFPALPHPSSFGYVSGRNIKENARQHCGHKFLLTADVENFFPSITQLRVEALFVESGIGPEVSNLLSRFVTIDGALPLGLPTSPSISNAVFLPIDIELLNLATQSGATFTRYSDDLSFSSDGLLPEIEEIAAIVGRHGFTLATQKTRRSRRGQAHYVTGLSISERDQPHAPKDKKRRLRQELYYANKFGLGDHFVRRGINDADVVQQQINRLDGLVKYISFHEPNLAPSLKPLWTEILREAGARASYSPRGQNRIPFYISLDEAEYESPRGKILALGLSVSQHQDRLSAATQEVLDAAQSDFYTDGNYATLANKGLHFADATPDLCLKYVDRLQTLPFEGYVVMAALRGPSVYQETYIRLLKAVIRRRLMAAESEFAAFVVEKNNKVSEDSIRELVTETLAQLKAENNRRPRSVFVEFVSKPDLRISVPDFLLGVLGRYLQSTDPAPGRPLPRDQLMFERIRDKYRLILDADEWVEFSRRRPIRPWAATS